jgi:membrane protein YdbS with pleckstrin-like domain
VEFPLSKIEHVEVSQSPVGRSLNFGTVIVTGSGGTRHVFRCVIDPFAFRRAIVSGREA